MPNTKGHMLAALVRMDGEGTGGGREPNLQSRGDGGLGGHLQQPQRGYKRRVAAKMEEEPWREGSTCRIGMWVVGDLVLF